MMKKLMCALMALLLTIGLCNLDVVGIKAASEEVEEKGDETKNSNGLFGILYTSLKLSGFDSAYNELPNICGDHGTFDKAIKFLRDTFFSVDNTRETKIYYFNPGRLQVCSLIIASPNLKNYKVSLYSSNGDYIDSDDNLLDENSYYSEELGCRVVGLIFPAAAPVYIKVEPKGNWGGNYIFALLTFPPFEDVADDAWYYNTIKQVYDYGLMTGTTTTKFSPDAKMTRGMVATVLYRMAGAPNVAYAKKFSDVKKSDYFSIAVTWASNKKVINGYGNGKFGANDNITREQMAAMCYNYAKFRTGKTPTATASLTKFKDYKNVTKNMEIPMKWAVAAGLISGSNGKLNPTGKATRAECAKMLLQLSKIAK